MMRYFMAIIALLIFTTPNTFASGGPSFDQLYDHDQKQKSAVKLISQGDKNADKRKICFVNVAQNKVEKKHC